MLRSSLLLLCLIALPAQAEQLYKCINAEMEVTYSNLPCSRFPGMREAKTIEADPGPPVSETARPGAKEKAAEDPAMEKSRKTAGEKTEAKRVLKAERSEKNQCDKLSEQISEVMDKMDAARHRGYTPKQESEWNQKIKELTAKKNRLNCF